MIDRFDQTLTDWMTARASQVKVRVGTHANDAQQPTIFLHLFDISVCSPTRQSGPRPIELTLSYLVSASAADTLMAHRTLSDVLVAAIDEPLFEVDIQSMPFEYWRTLEVAPQPSFRINAVVRKERIMTTPRITQPVAVKVSPIASVTGSVIGPKNLPIPQARVEVPGTTDVTYTDSRGQFQFTTLGGNATRRQLKVSARGIEKTVSAAFRADEPIVIRFHSEEK